jgi:hypothetical protein
MSVRNIDSDLALCKLNDLFHLHRYNDCVVFINRLNHIILKQIMNLLPIDLYLSRLPYTIEIFEAIYAKIFIIEPDKFPARVLQSDRLIDKMVAYFSSAYYNNVNSIYCNYQSDNEGDEGSAEGRIMDILEPVDNAKMLDSFENCIRIISYVQPSLYSRMLFFKYAIDRALLKFEKDSALFNRSLAQTLKKTR